MLTNKICIPKSKLSVLVLLDFWASWCAPCRVENPNVLNAYDKYPAVPVLLNPDIYLREITATWRR